MKKISLSIIAIGILVSNTYAASTLAEAFSQGSIRGEVKAYYWTRDEERSPYIDKGAAKTDGELFTFGMSLGYTTDSYYGFKMDTEFQSSHSPWANQDAISAFRRDEYGSGEVLSVANISYGYSKTNVAVGRMYLAMPNASSSGNRMIKQAYEAAKITNTDIPNTKIEFAWIERFQNRTDAVNKSIGKFEEKFGGKEFKDGAYTVAITNKSIDNTTLIASYIERIDQSKTTFLQATHGIGMFDFGGQYWYTKEENLGSVNAIAAKASFKTDKLNLHISASSTSNTSNSIDFGIGNGSDIIYTYSIMNADNYIGGTDAYQVGTTYSFLPNAWVQAIYTLSETENINLNAEYDYINFAIGYKFTNGWLENTEIKLITEDTGKDRDEKEYRLYLSYKF